MRNGPRMCALSVGGSADHGRCFSHLPTFSRSIASSGMPSISTEPSGETWPRKVQSRNCLPSLRFTAKPPAPATAAAGASIIAGLAALPW